MTRKHALVLIMLLALGLRLYGIGWDDGYLFHPDERAILTHTYDLSPPTSIGEFLDADTSPWNPRWFPYGSLPLYLLKAVQLGAAPVTDLSLTELSIVGRALSALADTLTVGVVYLIGLRVFDRRVGLLAAVFTALAVLHIQLSHFYAVDTLLTLFIVLAVFLLVRFTQEGRPRDALLAGAVVGLSLATKVSAAPILLPLLLAHVLFALQSRPGQETTGATARDRALGVPIRWWKAAGLLALSLAVLGAVVLVTAPYTLLDHERFLADVTEQSEMVRRIRDYPYTRQYQDTTRYLFQVRQLTVFGLGPPVGLAAWGGLLFAVGAFAVRHRREEALLLAWVIPLLVITLGFEVKFLRYLLPVTPFLLIHAAHTLVATADRVGRRRPRLLPAARLGIGLIVGSAALSAVAYLSIYASPHPAVRASAWVNANATPGALMLKEHWEEGLPDLGRYRVAELPLYEPDNPAKTEAVADLLADADYLLFYSSRLYGTIPRLPERYPDTTDYYRLLFTGGLGYELVHFERAYPSLPGVALVNDTFSRPGLPVPATLAISRPAPVTIGLGFADESFSVYDHPLVLIFRNTARLPRERLKGLLIEGLPEAAFDPMLMPPALSARQQAGGGLGSIAPEDGVGARFPLGVWALATYAVALAALPIGMVVFRALPDRGYLLSRSLGLLLLAYVPWLLASLEWAPFGRGSIAFGLLLLGGASTWAAARSRAELRTFFRRHWRLVLTQEALFLGALLAFTALRAANPDLWHPFRGGEKPMDFAYLNAVVRSSFMPPYDPWFAGGAMNYYYFGHFMVATLVKATGVPTVVAYNLAVPLFFALTVGSAFSIGFNLAEGARRGLRGPLRALRWSPVVAGLLGTLFVAVVGNLQGAGQLLTGAWGRLVDGMAFPPFDFWAPTRMMPPDPPGFEITEFPFFTFLFADLHAHLLAMPLALLAIGLALNTLLLARPGVSTARFLGSLTLLSLTVGGLWATNAWDFLTYLGLGVLVLAAGEYLRRRRVGLPAIAAAAGAAGGFVVLAIVLWLPYHLRLNNAYGGITTAPAHTTIAQYLAIHGLFLFVVVTMLALTAPRRPIAWFRAATPARRWAGGLAAVVALSFVLAAVGVGHSVVALLLVLLLATAAVGLRWLGLRPRTLGDRAAPTTPRFPTPYAFLPIVLLGMALGIGVIVEVVAVRGDLDRMNTVFKLYLQAWLFSSIASAYALWYLGFQRGLLRRVDLRRGAWLAALAVLVASAAVYPALGPRARLADRFVETPLTLDGTAYMREAVYRDDDGTVELRWDEEAMRWLRENVTGSPVIVEGRTPLYRWGGRVSVYTGLPAVIGWDWHQRQQRCGLDPCPAVARRTEDVDRVYTTTDREVAMDLLRAYNVTYVYVGQTERLYYPSEGVEKFAGMAEAGQLRVAYRNQEVTVYEVPSRRVPSAASAGEGVPAG